MAEAITDHHPSHEQLTRRLLLTATLKMFVFSYLWMFGIAMGGSVADRWATEGGAAMIYWASLTDNWLIILVMVVFFIEAYYVQLNVTAATWSRSFSTLR